MTTRVGSFTLSVFTSNEGSAEVGGSTFDEQQLAVLEQFSHALDRALANRPAEIPYQNRTALQSRTSLPGSSCSAWCREQRLVAEDFLAVSYDDWMVLDVESAVAQRLAQIGHFLRLLAVLETLRGIGRLANAAVDLALEPQLGLYTTSARPTKMSNSAAMSSPCTRSISSRRHP